MKIFAISDLHLSFSSDKPMDIFGTMWENHFEQIVEDWQNKVSDDDIVLLAGDLSWAMTFENALIDVNEIEKLKGKKVIIRGNHDYWWQSYTKMYKIFAEKNIFAIQNNALKFGNFIFLRKNSRMLRFSPGYSQMLKGQFFEKTEEFACKE